MNRITMTCQAHRHVLRHLTFSRSSHLTHQQLFSYATKVDRTGAALPSQTPAKNINSAPQPSRHRPKKSALSPQLNAAKKAYTQQQQQPSTSKITNEASSSTLKKQQPSSLSKPSSSSASASLSALKAKQAENIQQLMKMLLLIEEQANKLNQQSEEEVSSSSSALNLNLPSMPSMSTFGGIGGEQSSNGEAMMEEDYMTTFSFFRSAVALQQWYMLPVIGHDSEESKNAGWKTRAKVRIFTDLTLYKQFIKERCYDAKETRPVKFDNLPFFIEALLLNEKLKEETDVEEKRLLKNRLAQHPLSYEISHVPGHVSNIVIDDVSGHAFVLRRDYFRPVVLWRAIMEVESAIHAIRLWALPKSAKHRFDNTAFLEDHPKAKDDPIQALLDFNRYLLIKKSDTGGFLMIPESTIDAENHSDPSAVKNTHVAVFTAPDFAYEFVDAHGIDREQIKVVRGDRLFKMLNQVYDRIGGIVVNAGNLLPNAINQEVAFTKDFVRSVAEAQEEEEEDEE